jgi:signal transduction histidine kinase
MARTRRTAQRAAGTDDQVIGIEPDLLRILRVYTALVFGLAVFVLWNVRQEADPTNPRFPETTVWFFGLALLLISWRTMRPRMGRWYLPVIITLITLGPIISSAVTIAGRLDAGMSPNESLADYWQPFFLLWVPLLMVAWQYRYRAVVAFAAVTTFLDLAVSAPPLEQYGAEVAIVIVLIIARGLLFAFVGLFVVKLVAGQKGARRALADHATTLEELATSRERNRLARELHDTLAHSLSAVAVQLEAVKALFDDEPEQAKVMLDRSLEGARDGLSEARRAIQALRASPIEEFGLAGALGHLGSSVEARTSLGVAMAVDDDLGELRPDVEQAVYRIADESLTNAVRHAEAQRVDVTVSRSKRRVVVEVRDDGRGFDASAPVPNGHVGLQGMRERAAMVGGTLDVRSSSGGGTTVRFEAPV